MRMPSLSGWVQEHRLPSIQTRVKPSTFDSYQRNIRLHVLPRLGDRQLRHLTPEMLNQLYSELMASGNRRSPGHRPLPLITVGISLGVTDDTAGPSDIRFIDHRTVGSKYGAGRIVQRAGDRKQEVCGLSDLLYRRVIAKWIASIWLGWIAARAENPSDRSRRVSFVNRERSAKSGSTGPIGGASRAAADATTT